MNIPASTLHYYDREGFFKGLTRSSGGKRTFSEGEINTLRMVECLKASGMQIKEIKTFLGWCEEGAQTFGQRRRMFYERKAAVEQQMVELQKTLQIIEYKCWYYDTAIELGSEQMLQNMPINDMPENVKHGKLILEDRTGE